MIFNPNVMAAAGGGGGAVIQQYTGDGKTSRSLELLVEPVLVLITTEHSDVLYLSIIPTYPNMNKATAFATKSPRSSSSRGGLITYPVSLDGRMLSLSSAYTDYYNIKDHSYIVTIIPKA